MYKCKHFKIYELVDKETYEIRGDKAWALLDDRLLAFADYLRDEFGPITINDWEWGGKNQWRGVRTSGSPYYRPYSQHSFGRGLDMIFQNITAEEVRKWLRENESLWQMDSGIFSITCEEDVSWLHLDLRNNLDGYNSFKP